MIDVEVADGGNRIGKMLVVGRGSSHTRTRPSSIHAQGRLQSHQPVGSTNQHPQTMVGTK